MGCKKTEFYICLSCCQGSWPQASRCERAFLIWFGLLTSGKSCPKLFCLCCFVWCSLTSMKQCFFSVVPCPVDNSMLWAQGKGSFVFQCVQRPYSDQQISGVHSLPCYLWDAGSILVPVPLQLVLLVASERFPCGCVSMLVLTLIFWNADKLFPRALPFTPCVSVTLCSDGVILFGRWLLPNCLNYTMSGEQGISFTCWEL